MIVVDLIYNLSVIVALSVLSGFADKRFSRDTNTGKIIQGLLFGGVAIIGMLNPFVLSEGIIFDGRSIIISLCTLFFGPLAGAISSVISIIFRLYLGGGGALTGTLVIIESFIFGYLFNFYRKKGKVKVTNVSLYIFGFIVTTIMMILFTTLPTNFISKTFSLITITVMTAYPFITLLIGKILSDQEDNKRYIEEIKESEERYRSITENAYNLISLIDLNGNYVYCNESYENVLGFKKEDLIGKSSFESVHPNEREMVMKLFEASLKNNVKVVDLQINIGCKDGSYKLVNLRAKSLDNDKGTTEKILIVAEDVTMQKKAETELIIAKEKAEESDRLKTAFLQNMSHEIRTPLNGILGFAELLNAEDVKKDEIKKFSGIIKSSGNRLLELIDNIIDISRIETGNVKTYYTDIKMRTILQDVYNMFLIRSQESGVEIRIKEPEIKIDNFVSDSLKLHQIITNLVNNAMKFTKEGFVEISYEKANEDIMFSIKDTGAGIPKEHQEKIFNRFYQADMSLSRGFEGAGLGLAICRGLVELLKGKIWLESEPGKGTTFYFTIPYKKSETNNDSEQSNGYLKYTKDKTILIVDDDEMSYEYLEMILKREGAKTLKAYDGKEAVEICKNRNDINLVLMDIKMPVMSGLIATELIKKERPNLPIIAQTAYAFNTEREQALNAGFDEYLTKPIDKSNLFEIISKYL